MKINRLIALAVIAVIAIAAMGFISTQALAQSKLSTIFQVQSTKAINSENISNSAGSEQDQEQVGDQTGADTGQTGTVAEDKNQGPSQTQIGEQSGDQQAPDNGSGQENELKDTSGKDGEDATPAGTPAITADAALKAAQAHLKTAAAGKVTLDDENGKLIYSVELNNQDVKVDGMTGAVLGVDLGGE